MPKVLCLCGYTQSASIFKNRLSAIRKQCSAGTTFKFLDPPHIVHSVNLPDGSLVSYDSTADTSNPEELPRAWFFAKDVEGQPGLKRYEGMGDTWKLLKETLEAERFDVVLGFSQGAGMAGALCSLLSLPTNTINHPPFKLAVLVSGFALQDSENAFFPKEGLSSANTLHILGKNDTIVSLERSQTLVDRFQSPRVEIHDGGHYVPSKANFRNFFKALFDSIDDEDSEAWRNISLPNVASGTSTPTMNEGRL